MPLSEKVGSIGVVRSGWEGDVDVRLVFIPFAWDGVGADKLISQLQLIKLGDSKTKLTTCVTIVLEMFTGS